MALLFLFIKRMYGRLSHITALSYDGIWHSILLKFGLYFLGPLPVMTVSLFISTRLEVGVLWGTVFYKEMELIAGGKSVNIWKV